MLCIKFNSIHNPGKYQRIILSCLILIIFLFFSCGGNTKGNSSRDTASILNNKQRKVSESLKKVLKKMEKKLDSNKHPKKQKKVKNLLKKKITNKETLNKTLEETTNIVKDSKNNNQEEDPPLQNEPENSDWDEIEREIQNLDQTLQTDDLPEAEIEQAENLNQENIRTKEPDNSDTPHSPVPNEDRTNNFSTSKPTNTLEGENETKSLRQPTSPSIIQPTRPKPSKPKNSPPPTPKKKAIKKQMQKLFEFDKKAFGKKSGSYGKRKLVPLTSTREADLLIFRFLYRPIPYQIGQREDYETNVLKIKKIAKQLTFSKKTLNRIEEVALLLRMYRGVNILISRFFYKNNLLDSIIGITKRINNKHNKFIFEDYAEFYHTPHKLIFYKKTLIKRSKKQQEENKLAKAQVLPELELIYKTLVMARVYECYQEKISNQHIITTAEKNIESIIRMNWDAQVLKKIKEETIPTSFAFPSSN